jgi:hypothetical protein
MSDQLYQQSYKNRAQAYALFIKAGGYPVSNSQFYEDCEKYQLVAPDKTVALAGLLAYIREKCDIKPETGQSLADKSYTDEMRELDMREKRATVEAAERKNRKEDDRWMEKVDHEIQLATFAGLVYEMLDQQKTIKLSELIYLAGGNINRAAEFSHGLEAMIATAMAEAVKESTRMVTFEEDEEDGKGSYANLADDYDGIEYSPTMNEATRKQIEETEDASE